MTFDEWFADCALPEGVSEPHNDTEYRWAKAAWEACAAQSYELELLRRASAMIYFRLTGKGNEDAQALVNEIDRVIDRGIEIS